MSERQAADWGQKMSEANEYLHGMLHVEQQLEDEEEYIETLSDEEYHEIFVKDRDWPFHVDFYGHPADEELEMFDDQRHKINSKGRKPMSTERAA